MVNITVQNFMNTFPFLSVQKRPHEKWLLNIFTSTQTPPLSNDVNNSVYLRETYKKNNLIMEFKVDQIMRYNHTFHLFLEEKEKCFLLRLVFTS